MKCLPRYCVSRIMRHLLIIIASVFGFNAVAQDPPNILVIVADDLGYADVEFHPQHRPEVVTPHLDALAKESVVCQQGYVTGQVCSPTRAGLMTGRYQQRLGLYTGGEAGSGLPMDVKIFPQYLKSRGYVTGQFGKWHLGPTLEWSPAHRGFDEVFGFLGRGAHDYFKLDDPEDPIYRGLTPVKEQGYLTDRLGEETAAFIAKHRDQPVFAYLAFNAVHSPMQAPAEELAKFNTGDANRDARLAMGKRMDDAIGLVVAELKAQGRWQNTLTFFISDNGGPLAQSADNSPLRGGKHGAYEGGVRTPFLVCWPAKLKPAQSSVVVSSLDILPTALAAAGAVDEPTPTLDGVDLVPILSGQVQASSRDLFWCNSAAEGWWAIRSGDWKLVCDSGELGLFDLATDIGESKDLTASRPELVAQLTKRHDAWLSEMADPVKGGDKRLDAGEKPEPSKKKERRKRSEAKKE
jgi:arylsulfatase A-like enzyme